MPLPVIFDIKQTDIYYIVCFCFTQGTELPGDLSILQECILCRHHCSHSMCVAGLCYQASETCEAEGSQGRVRNRVNWSYIEELRSFIDDYDKLVFSLLRICQTISSLAKRIMWWFQLHCNWPIIYKRAISVGFIFHLFFHMQHMVVGPKLFCCLFIYLSCEC